MPKAGRYHIDRKIADGGMAEIFVGTQHGMEGFERPVVLKRILAPLVADPQFRNMLIDEAHVAMGLNHSNIVQVLDLGHVRGRYFLVLEFVDGWDLSQILARANNAGFAVPPEILLYVAAEICRALAYAHSRIRDGKPLAIVHRDVSPQNVLISEQGEVKLTDFGIAKAMGRREHTSQGVIKGKLAFMSPEQASGAVLDNRSDLFALGTMLYLLFTGRRPFESPTDLESIMRVRECRFQPPEVVKPGLHAELVKLIKRAMQSSPKDRYQSADEMLLDIENVQRTAYKPAGQTELKRWLKELQERDHCLTNSHAASAKPASAEKEELDVGEGAEVVFDESNLIEIDDVVRSIQPTIAASSQLIAPLLPKTDDQTTTATPTAIRQSRIPARIIVFAMIVAALAVGAWLAIPDNKQIPGKATDTTQTKQEKSALKPKPEPKPEAKTAHLVAADAGSKIGIDAGESAHSEKLGSGTTAVAAPEGEEEEETLLKHAEPDDGERVIGEEEGVVSKKKPTEKTSKPAFEPVSVKVVSHPEGAVIKLGKRVFGRAPMNLRFRPGISFELTFVKQGYEITTKRFVPSGRKNQVVKVTLQKKSQPKKKSILRRIFGGR
jgi:serine/threonine protein kinase